MRETQAFHRTHVPLGGWTLKFEDGRTNLNGPFVQCGLMRLKPCSADATATPLPSIETAYSKRDVNFSEAL